MYIQLRRIAKTLSMMFVISMAFTTNASAWSDNDIAVTVIGDQTGQSNVHYGLSIAVDSSGNTYTSGSFEGTVVFGSGTGTTTLTSNGGRDAFVAKHDASGTLLWVKTFGGPLTDQVKDVTVDRDGNVVMAGEFYGSVDFDPGVGVDSLTALANTGPSSSWDWLGAVVWKLNSDGNYLWAKAYDGLLFDTGVSVAVDGDGNIAFSGAVAGTIDLDPSPERTVAPSPFGGMADIFVSVFTPSGILKWANRLGSSGYEVGQSVAFDSTGALYVSGSFQRTTDFDPGDGMDSLTAVGADSNPTDMYISKFDTNGAFQWVRQYKGYGTGDGPAVVSVDSNNSIYVSGNFNGQLIFYTDQNKQDTFTVTSVGTRDSFISKWTSSGTHVWTKTFGGSGGAAYGGRTAVEGNGNIFFIGSESGTVDFNPGSESFNLTSNSLGYTDIFISKFNSSGDFLWAKNMGSAADDNGNGIAVDVSGNVYFTGTFQGTADLDPSDGVKNFVSTGGIDIFISKLNSAGSALISAMALTPGEIAAKAAATRAAAEAAVNAAKAAAEAAEVKREAEKKSARADIATSVKSAKELTVESFSKAEIPGINASNIDAVKAELSALPEESKNDFNQILKVARKYEVLGIIGSGQVKSIQANTFVEIGLIPETSKNKVALSTAVKNLPAEARDSLVEIKAAIEAETKKIEARKDRVASLRARSAIRTIR
jgi:hypothetical protein